MLHGKRINLRLIRQNDLDEVFELLHWWTTSVRKK
jgi:hypothetical protein